MKKLLFILLCSFGIQLEVVAQKQSSVSSSTKEKTYYVLCNCAITNTVDYIQTYVLFAPFPIKGSKSTNIPFFSEAASIKISGENISSIAHIFDEEFGFTNIKAGDKIMKNSHGCWKYATIDSAIQRYDEDVNRILNLYKGWKSDRFGLFLVTWQPPTKFTGIDPTNSAPIIRNGKATAVTNNTKTSTASINIEKKDTSFEEAEAKRKVEEKKAEAQRQVQLQAKENKAQPQDKARIKKVLTGSSRQ